jgi:hypothetical protein
MPVRRKKRSTTSAKRKTRVVYRKAKTAVRRKRRGLSAGPLGKANLRMGIMDAVQGAIGGVIASFVANQKFLDAQSETNKGLLLIGASVLTGAYLKRPAIAAGMGAVAGIKLAKGLGAGTLVGLSENDFELPIAEGVDPLLLPYGLQDGGNDYAGLSEDIYASNYANVY